MSWAFTQTNNLLRVIPKRVIVFTARRSIRTCTHMKKLILFSLIFLSGCATSYHPTSFSGGYTETQLAENIWRVSFEGNGYTRQQRAEDFALLRCAEVTLEKGFTHFALSNSASRSDFSSANTSSTTSYRGDLPPTFRTI